MTSRTRSGPITAVGEPVVEITMSTRAMAS